MGRRHRDEDAGLADLQAPHSMEHGHALDPGPAGPESSADLPQLGLRHRRVGLVLEILHGTATGLVADDTGENHDATRPGSSTAAAIASGEWMLDHLVGIGGRRGDAERPAPRGEQTQLIAGPETVIGGHVVVADREQRVGPKRAEHRMAIDDGRPRRLYGAVVGRARPRAALAPRLRDTGRRVGHEPARPDGGS